MSTDRAPRDSLGARTLGCAVLMAGGVIGLSIAALVSWLVEVAW